MVEESASSSAFVDNDNDDTALGVVADYVNLCPRCASDCFVVGFQMN